MESVNVSCWDAAVLEDHPATITLADYLGEYL
jgi:hypothetical protein